MAIWRFLARLLPSSSPVASSIRRPIVSPSSSSIVTPTLTSLLLICRWLIVCYEAMAERGPINPRIRQAAWAGQADIVSYLCTHRADVGAAAMDGMAAIQREIGEVINRHATMSIFSVRETRGVSFDDCIILGDGIE